MKKNNEVTLIINGKRIASNTLPEDVVRQMIHLMASVNLPSREGR